MHHVCFGPVTRTKILIHCHPKLTKVALGFRKVEPRMREYIANSSELKVSKKGLDFWFRAAQIPVMQNCL